jgi:hypothetical protein
MPKISLILVLLATFLYVGKSISFVGKSIPLCTLDQEWKSNGFHREIGYPTKSDDSEFKFIFKTLSSQEKDTEGLIIWTLLSRRLVVATTTKPNFGHLAPASEVAGGHTIPF